MFLKVCVLNYFHTDKKIRECYKLSMTILEARSKAFLS